MFDSALLDDKSAERDNAYHEAVSSRTASGAPRDERAVEVTGDRLLPYDAAV